MEYDEPKPVQDESWRENCPSPKAMLAVASRLDSAIRDWTIPLTDDGSPDYDRAANQLGDLCKALMQWSIHALGGAECLRFSGGGLPPTAYFRPQAAKTAAALYQDAHTACVDLAQRVIKDHPPEPEEGEEWKAGGA